jgi:hypothetical protein
MFERFTEKAGRVIFFARYEASQYGSSFTCALRTKPIAWATAALGRAPSAWAAGCGDFACGTTLA